ncbi:trimeric intracellular cation channel family protein [Anaerovorax odorimutans]|uniref:Trimeric intracellular cation channel family protein n=1 Tax=Anaerovorax odorimutans TaxID=109327 RepID=A0ABT1RK63_9FIRM|nr:trimeric intracellular cation channel family protein [Anaerovorax odorimutans]MCQ4635570.1 trimeric intracellular cation channel family protein [Anaerovorax odorimutans]
MEFLSLMEIIGTVAFAVSGALVAIEKELDYYGIVFLAIITAVGGGILRDLLIDLPLPLALENPLYVLISIATAAVVILFYKKFVKYQNIILFFDAIGLAAFTAIGAEAALTHDVYMPFVVITLAVLTGTGGGILRDVFVKEIPFVFRKEVYAVACILGAAVFMGAYHLLNQGRVSMYICFGVTLAVRLIAVKMNWHLAKVKRIEGK